MPPTRTLALSVALAVAAATCGCANGVMSFLRRPGPVAVPKQDVVVDTLPNGATVIVKQSRLTPVVTVRGYVHAGGLYEGKYLGCGISHLTEHLVAMGAEHLMDGAASPAAKEPSVPDRVRQIGGQANAFTSLDHTVYYISAEASRTMDCIDLIADWLVRPEMSQADFDREHGVVQREIEMGKDDPGRQLWYAHAANVFGDHPAGLPVIGYAEPLRGLTFADLKDYHARMYVPQNMVFVIVGDVDVAAVLQRVRKAVGDAPRGRAVDLSLPPVAPVIGVRRRSIEMPDVTETLQELSFQTIPLVHEDLYALDLLSDVLTASPTSRLNERILRQRKLVTAISTSSWTPTWGCGAFSVSFRCAPDKADAAEAAIVEELQAVTRTLVSRAELDVAKREKIAQWVLSQQSVESQAGTLGDDYTSTGDVGFSADYTQRIQAVTAEQVRDVARRYFAFDQMVITRVTPPGGAAAAVPAEATQPVPMAAVFTLPNGLRVILNPFPNGGGGRGLVAMAMVTEGGLLLEDPNTNGLGSMMMALSIKGAGRFSADDIAKTFHSIAGECGNNTVYWQATVLDDKFAQALDVLGEIVQHPTFSKEELDILRPAQLAAVERVDQEWQGRLNKVFRERFFEGSPYAMLPVGSKDVVAAATPEQLATHHQRSIRAGGSVLAICGQFDPAAAQAMVEKIFSSMPPGRVALRIPPRRIPAADEQCVIRVNDQPVAGVIVAVPGMKLSDLDDRVAMDVLDTILSGYQLPSGWLHDELRGRRLVYMVHAYNWPGLAPGAFMAIAACQPDNARRVVEVIHRDFAKAAGYLPSPQEVDEAVNVILTAEMLDNQSAASLAMSAALDELYGLGYDWRQRMVARYRAITPQDVRNVGAKYLSKGLMTVVTGPLDEQALQAAPETSAPAQTQPASVPTTTGASHD